MKHLNIKISGQVQGVFFRHAAKEKAEELGLKGFAKNEPDDSVYIEVEGKEEALKKFIEWCKKGPASARIEKVEVAEGENKKFSQFETL